jgi:hypothetical protein
VGTLELGSGTWKEHELDLVQLTQEVQEGEQYDDSCKQTIKIAWVMALNLHGTVVTCSNASLVTKMLARTKMSNYYLSSVSKTIDYYFLKCLPKYLLGG